MKKVDGIFIPLEDQFESFDLPPLNEQEYYLESERPTLSISETTKI